jgi:hypothetical protein
MCNIGVLLREIIKYDVLLREIIKYDVLLRDFSFA